jgi:Reverse transcriptase (RNA-dependent DNA polymerase)
LFCFTYTGDLALLVLLGLSAAFDIVDHAMLLQRLKVTYGLTGSVWRWFSSYLDDRTQYVGCGASKSASSVIMCGVPQGSVVGPILFLPIQRIYCG